MNILFCTSISTINIEQMITQVFPVLPILFLTFVVGCICCFYGHRLLYIIIGACGFTVVFLASWLLLSTFTPLFYTNIILQLFISFILGLGGIAISFLIYKLGIFLLGFLGACVIGFILTELMEYSLVMLLVGCIGGILSLIIEKVVAIVATASIGSLIIVWTIIRFLEYGGVIYIGEGFEPTYIDMIARIAWIGLTALGCSIQYKNINPEKKQAKEQPSSS